MDAALEDFIENALLLIHIIIHPHLLSKVVMGQDGRVYVHW